MSKTQHTTTPPIVGLCHVKGAHTMRPLWHQLPTRILEYFARWFSSAAGVWQTLGLCAVVVAYEHLHSSADPNGFQLLYWLTVYSAITQPMLAYVSDKSDITGSDTHRLVEQIAAAVVKDGSPANDGSPA